MSPPPALIVAADAPATPGAQEAREAAEAELAKPAYHPVPNLLGRLWRWLVEHLDPTTAIPGIPPLHNGFNAAELCGFAPGVFNLIVVAFQLDA